MSDLISFHSMPDEGEAPRYPLMGAWICQTFSPWLMPVLYALSWLWLQSRKSHRKPIEGASELIEVNLAPYASSLYPVLALTLQRQHFLSASEAPQPCFDLGLACTGQPWLHPDKPSLAGEMTASRLLAFSDSDSGPRLAVVDPEHLPFADESLGTYRMNNVFQRYTHRNGPLDEAYRVLRPGGLLHLSDVTRNWAESMWPAWLADQLGLLKLKRQLIRGKLLDTQEVLIPEPDWWRTEVSTARWELLDLRPFLGTTSLRLSSLFESLNFKQGGPSPIWIEEKLRKNLWLAKLYRALLLPLAQLLVELDESETERSGGAFVMVTLRKRGKGQGVNQTPLNWCCPNCHSPLSSFPQHLSCPTCPGQYPIQGGIARLGADLCPV